MHYLKFFFLLICFLELNLTAQISSDSVVDMESNIEKSQYYFSGSINNAFRSFTDNSAYQIYNTRNNEVSISSGVFEIGTFIPLAKRIRMSFGVGVFSGGEAYSYNDSISDSTFYYKNVYQQIGIPVRLNYEVGHVYQIYGFAGIIPSSILHRKYESIYTDSNGSEFVNDIEKLSSGLASFQLVGSLGLGFKYNFNNGAISIYSEYRRHITNTYESNFIIHRMRAYGVGASIELTVE